MSGDGMPRGGVIRGRLAKALKEGKSGREAEEYALATTDVATLGHEGRRLLDWICKHDVWPATRRRRRGVPAEQKELFT